ncbi:MAG: hypothetical protein EHM58_19735 [Ignavibacteriae bacterium]|nr:MAG: hypothetical protein EHM58_19735 [Ignavibacteriota bacterium]
MKLFYILIIIIIIYWLISSNLVLSQDIDFTENSISNRQNTLHTQSILRKAPFSTNYDLDLKLNYHYKQSNLLSELYEQGKKPDMLLLKQKSKPGFKTYIIEFGVGVLAGTVGGFNRFFKRFRSA